MKGGLNMVDVKKKTNLILSLKCTWIKGQNSEVNNV
jgi:hypothetical protein